MMRLVLRGVVFLAVPFLVFFSGCSKKTVVEEVGYTPSLYDIDRINEWRVLIIKLNTKWAEPGKRFW